MRGRCLPIVGLILSLTTPVLALDDLPRQEGWRGFIGFGLGVSSIESQLVVGNSLYDFGEADPDSIVDGPGAETVPLPYLVGEAGYFWEGSRTYLVLGNSLEDLLRYDFTSRLGVRKGLADESILGLDLLFTGFTTKVWADPYVQGEDRRETDRSARGARVAWDRIGGSGLEVAVAVRNFAIDREESGEFLSLTGNEQRSLDREGTLREIDVSYRLSHGPKHTWRPRLILRDHDLDGEAVAHTRTSLQLTYIYGSPKAVLVFEAVGSRERGEAVHPIYDERLDADGLGLTFTGIFPGLFGSPRWSWVVSAAVFEDDATIDFHDASARVMSLGGLVRF